MWFAILKIKSLIKKIVSKKDTKKNVVCFELQMIVTVTMVIKFCLFLYIYEINKYIFRAVKLNAEIADHLTLVPSLISHLSEKIVGNSLWESWLTS